MPTQTPNLKLDTYNNTTDSQSKFQTFRTSIAGDQTSNMTKIDKWSGDVNTKLTLLENNKPTILVKANWISVGYYEAISSDIVDFKLDMLVTVKLNQDNDGTLTMKINELSVKSFLKYDTTGVLVNLDVGDLRKDREYQFRYDGTSFVWQGGTSADQLNIVGTVGNIVSVADDNTIKDSGVSVGTGALSTTDKTVVGGINELDTRKIDKTQIKNTLTETVEGSVLDATQGKILDDKVSILSALQNGFKLYKSLADLGLSNGSETMLEIAKAMQINSILYMTTGSFSNPSAFPQSRYGVLSVIKTGNDRTVFNYTNTDNVSYTGTSNATQNIWAGWKQIATTDKVDILFPYNSATFSPVDSYFPNKCISSDAKKELYIWLKMTDNTKFKAGTRYAVGTIPVGYRPTSNMAGICSCKNRNEGIKQYQASYEIVSGTGVVYVVPSVDCDNLLLQEVF